jgi:probable rRNA maturation factor
VSGQRRRTRHATQRGLRLSFELRVRGWSPARGELRLWASAALGARAAGRELGVCVVGASESRRLNARFRGRDRATNVLSFPASRMPRPRRAGAAPLGELVICARVLAAEARAQQKTLRAHWAHLIVHGTLHLAGYDHERAADAQRMERREIAVLRRLGFANPYRS